MQKCLVPGEAVGISSCSLIVTTALVEDAFGDDDDGVDDGVGGFGVHRARWSVLMCRIEL